jgi:hypothetical protein
MTDDKREGVRGPGDAPGQKKTYEVTNPTTGEIRIVTQAEWREQKLGQQGFQKPPDLPEEGEVDVPE